ALRAEPPAVVRRLVQIDVAAAFVGADAEAGAAVLAQPDRQAPDGAGQVFRGDRGATAGPRHVPVAPEVRGWTGNISRRAFSSVTASASRPVVPNSKTSRSRRWARRNTPRSFS